VHRTAGDGFPGCKHSRVCVQPLVLR
jgi:hypothetical protein